MIHFRFEIFTIAVLAILVPALGVLSIYDTFEIELINERLTVPAEKYSYVSFNVSLIGKTQNRISVDLKEINEKYVNIYLFDEDSFRLYMEGKSAGPVFSARAEKTYSKVFIPEHSGNYYLVVENRDPFKKTVDVRVVWKYGVSAPDLFPEFVGVYPSEVFWGEKLCIDFRVKNFSPMKAEAHYIVIYLESEDGKLFEIDRIKVDTILAEETKSFSSEKLVSENIPRGLYRVKIVVDPLNEIEEYNETNNTIYVGKVFVKGESQTPTRGTTPGFEIFASVAALASVSLLIRKLK